MRIFWLYSLCFVLAWNILNVSKLLYDTLLIKPQILIQHFGHYICTNLQKKFLGETFLFYTLSHFKMLNIPTHLTKYKRLFLYIIEINHFCIVLKHYKNIKLSMYKELLNSELQNEPISWRNTLQLPKPLFVSGKNHIPRLLGIWVK